MRFLIFCLISFASTIAMAATPKCNAQFLTKKGPLLVKLKDEGSKKIMKSNDGERSIELFQIKDALTLEYRNISKNKENFLAYKLDCSHKGLNCEAHFNSSIEGKTNHRKLKALLSSRSNQYLDDGLVFFEVSRNKNIIQIKLQNIEWDQQFNPLSIGCEYE